MSEQPPRIPLPGSDKPAWPSAQPVGPVDPAQPVQVTLVLRRREELPEDLVLGSRTISRDELATRYGADPADVERVRAAVAAAGAEVTGVDPASRRVTVTAPVGALSTLFGATLEEVATGEGATRMTFRHRQGPLSLPAELSSAVVAVLGLDDRPQAQAHLRVAPAAGPRVAYTPPEVARAYDLPAGTDGAGQTVAIIELGGGFGQVDLDTYFAGLGLRTPPVTAVGVDGASNVPGGDPTGADGEVLLDIEVVGGVAPGAAQVVYFGPNTDQGFVDAVATAVHAAPTPVAVSISWGAPEESWTAQARAAMDQAFADAAALGVTVCAAAGDNGSSDGQPDGQAHVDYPAASPYVLGCGGTTLQADPATGAVQAETVWNGGPGGGATGGGVSTAYAVPAWQASAGVPVRAGSGTPGRGVPDVAGNADPATGYRVLVDGQAQVIGGTSAVSPLWSGLVSRLAQALGRPLGLLQPTLYAGLAPGTDRTGFRDITSGNNGAYAAAPGWDPCTGLGVPVGSALLGTLRDG